MIRKIIRKFIEKIIKKTYIKIILILNAFINNLNKDNNYPFIKMKLNHEMDKQNNISYKINEKAGIVNSRSYKNIFTNRYYPYGSHEPFQ